MRIKRFVLAGIFGIILPLIVWVGVAEGQSFRGGGDVTVPADQTINRALWAGGSNVDISGTVNGDVFCGGQTVNISGTVNGDVICGGQTVNISGTVNGDVRLAGQTVSISSKVSGSASVAAQTFTLDQTGSVGRDLGLAASTALLNGKVGRDLAASVSALTLSNTVGRDVQAKADNLKLDGSAHVGGNLAYSSYQKADIAKGASVAGTIHKSAPSSGGHSGGLRRFLFLFGLYVIVALLVLALVSVLVVPRLFSVVSAVALERPWRTLLVGFVASLVVPVIIVALLFTFIGIPLALLLLGLWLLVQAVSGLFFGFYVGRLVLRGSRNVIAIMMLGMFIVVAGALIPFLDIIVLAAWFWMGTGMVLIALSRHFERPSYTLPE